MTSKRRATMAVSRRDFLAGAAASAASLGFAESVLAMKKAAPISMPTANGRIE